MTAEIRVRHSPQLDTILMVETYIREHSGEFKRKALWQALPRRMQYSTFKQIIEYLWDSGKILVDCEGFVIWTHNPERVREIMSKPHLRLA